MTPAPAPSIVRRLSWRLMAIASLGLCLMCAGIYWASSVQIHRAQDRLLAVKVNKLLETSQAMRPRGGAAFLALLADNAPRRPGSRLELAHADGRPFYADPAQPPFLPSRSQRAILFDLPSPDGGAPLKGRFVIDVGHDDEMLASLGGILATATLLGTLGIGAATLLAARRALGPLDDLARQMRSISPGSEGKRLALATPRQELQAAVDQFNGLMARVEQAYQQLECFNADVAHELRTPLSVLIGQTEVALSRPRTSEQLHETLQSNLEELQRLARLVQDMLFLSRADRGETARRGDAKVLAQVVDEVADFHEAVLEERALKLAVIGQASARIDENLFKQAVSNLLDNATRFAPPGSTIRILLHEARGNRVHVAVENLGQTIPEAALQRLFDRFFRIEAGRADGCSHHGLGLAIVAAIARMHSGGPVAQSRDGITRIGFDISAA